MRSVQENSMYFIWKFVFFVFSGSLTLTDGDGMITNPTTRLPLGVVKSKIPWSRLRVSIGIRSNFERFVSLTFYYFSTRKTMTLEPFDSDSMRSHPKSRCISVGCSLEWFYPSSSLVFAFPSVVFLPPSDRFAVPWSRS